MYLIGRIKNILELQEFKNNFKKKSIILITDEQYPQNIIIDFVQKKIDLLNYIKIDDKVKVYINIKGREFINKDGTTRYFNTIQAWKIEKVDNKDLNFLKSDPNLDLYRSYDINDEDDLNNDNNELDEEEDDDEDDDYDEDDDDDEDDDYDEDDDFKKKRKLPYK
ncbi:MAG: DUF3127 domain-containing protein [Candidatus Shikimatogenerans bostrichidophilus]|nr:MAG: DUF3127 domain-containing protein [Candidatus Shikimatogenerans bostrichidophilus]